MKPEMHRKKNDGRRRAALCRAFGNVLMEQRKAIGISQATAAKRASTSTSKWSRTERGKRSPFVDECYYFALAVETDPVAMLRKVVKLGDELYGVCEEADRT